MSSEEPGRLSPAEHGAGHLGPTGADASEAERRAGSERRSAYDRRCNPLPLHHACAIGICVERRAGWDRRQSSDRRLHICHIVELRPQAGRTGWTEALCSCGQRSATCYGLDQLTELVSWHAQQVGDAVTLLDLRVDCAS